CEPGEVIGAVVPYSEIMSTARNNHLVEMAQLVSGSFDQAVYRWSIAAPEFHAISVTAGDIEEIESVAARGYAGTQSLSIARCRRLREGSHVRKQILHARRKNRRVKEVAPDSPCAGVQRRIASVAADGKVQGLHPTHGQAGYSSVPSIALDS